MIFLIALLFFPQQPKEWSWGNAQIGDYGYIEKFTRTDYEKDRWIKRTDGWHFDKIVGKRNKNWVEIERDNSLWGINQCPPTPIKNGTIKI